MRVGKTKIVSLLSFNISVSPPARLYVLYRMLTVDKDEHKNRELVVSRFPMRIYEMLLNLYIG